MISFTVYGEPVAQGRPVPTRIGTETLSYMIQLNQRNLSNTVKMAAAQHRPETLLEGPLQVTVKVYKRCLKKFSGKTN